MTKTRDLSDFLIEGGADLPLGKPHIVPGVLYPGYNDKQIDGTTALAASTTGPAGSTVTSSKYGTVQSDGRMYYYTDIKGSKPIKDPRIGGHFGSQRHLCDSIQLLEQETATHGANVYAVDGREWMRAVGGGITVTNDSNGNKVRFGTANEFMEITGYFSDINFSHYAEQDRGLEYKLDGGTQTTSNFGTATVATPLSSRYVDASSLINLGLSTTLGIHTIKLVIDDPVVLIYNIELIAQDTSSTANRSKIQIPPQNVVSFGKEFPISATAVHYDPFTTMSYGGSGTTLSALGSLIDTATSLGMDAWKAGTSNYHRPWNGGRVVKWVDSTGTIKTSVNMMPPNAQNISTTASNAVSDAHVIAGTNDDRINFNTTAIDLKQSELAKSFYNREFGNGAANSAGGGGTSNTYADASVLNAADNIAYVMDDGLTSMSAINVRYTGYDETLHRNGADTKFYLTFIGTGIGRHASRSSGIRDNFAQNLPYCTHTLAMEMYTNATTARWFLDGAEIIDNADSPYSSNSSSYHNIGEQLHIFQPKKPPIPEDCVVLADYMLMADFVPQTTAGLGKVSKGTRKVAVSRDVFFTGEAMSMLLSNETDSGWIFYLNSNGTNASTKLRIPSFGTNFVKRGFHDRSTLFIGDSSQSSNQTASTGSAAHGDTHRLTANQVLGVHNFGSNPNNGANGITSSFEIVSPIHTSSHYQEFENQLLHELVGGDRNMEQTNLVCSPDGKTWDEVTRDTSYIGKGVILTNTDTTSTSTSQVQVFDDWRGQYNSNFLKFAYNKDFAIAYDRMICLKDGQYKIEAHTIRNGAGDHTSIYINGVRCSRGHAGTSNHDTITVSLNANLKRGDYVQLIGCWYPNQSYSNFQINRI